MTPTVRKVTSWSLTWDRVTGGKRTGNHFFSKAKAQEVFDQKQSDGLSPSPIKEETKEWLCL